MHKSNKKNIKRTIPSNAEIGSLLQQFESRRFDIAEKLALSMTEKFPTHQFGWKILGTLLCMSNRLREAVNINQKAVDLSPKDYEAHNNLGITLKELGRFDEAEASYKRVISLKPNYAEAHYNLGITLKELGRFDEAEASYKQAISLKPNYAEAHYNLGNTLRELGKFNEAEASYKRVISLKPNFASAHNNLAITLKELGRFDEVEASCKQAISLKPNYAEAHYNLGITLDRLGRLDEAIRSYKEALSIKPDYELARAIKLHAEAKISDWASIKKDCALIPGIGTSEVGVSPFSILSLEDSPDRHRLRSEIYSKNKFLQTRMPIARNSSFPERVRIGYFSADFHNHATMYLMAQIFAAHDKKQFEIFAYSYGPDKQDEMRQRLVHNVNVFHEVSKMDDIQIVKLARQEKLHIAVDLKGFTGDARIGPFAYGLAPVQISYLGYPGTLGTKFIDYIVADPVIIPENKRKYYSEQIIYLPNSYQPNDNTRAICQKVITRQDVGLPRDGFVFCCFNNNYKISSKEFTIWMRLLSQIEGSVLWLLKSNHWAKENLKQEAKKQDINADRLIFAEKLPQMEHLSRLRLADLFLDTFNYNAHTTASDALWSDVPVVTKLGEGFAARVAGSLLRAVGIPELVTNDEYHYEALALELAKNSEMLLEVKKKLRTNRLSYPLFDSERYTKHLEYGYLEAYRNYYNGNKPKIIYVPD
jgi:protein O-GlcNAc transferase